MHDIDERREVGRFYMPWVGKADFGFGMNVDPPSPGLTPIGGAPGGGMRPPGLKPGPNPTFQFVDHVWIKYKHKFGWWDNWIRHKQVHCREDDPCNKPYDETHLELADFKPGESHVSDVTEWEYAGSFPNGYWLSPP